MSAGSDAELITRVRAGDRSAFGELYSRHSAAATNLARQFARSGAEVDDLVSEAFARVLDALLGGRGPDAAFRAYLFTTLRNTAFDRSRKDARLQFTDDVAAHETPESADDPVVLELENTMVAKAFAALPERWQVVLWHTQVERQSPAEVGVLLGMTANAVTSLAFRAREGLREAYLQAHLADTAAERCRATVDRLGGWARGGLSKREKAQVDAHLAECDRCRALAAELAEINTGMRMLLAPLLLGGAAAGYLAAGSTGAGVLVAGGAAVGAGGAGVAAGTAAGAGAAGSGSPGGVVAFLTRPWSIAAGGAAVAAAVAAALVITLSGGGGAPPQAAAPPPVTAATSAAGTSSATTSTGTSTATTSSAAPTTVASTPPPRPVGPPAVPPAPNAATTAASAPAPRTVPATTAPAPATPPLIGPAPPRPAPPAGTSRPPATTPSAATTPAATTPPPATRSTAPTAGTPPTAPPARAALSDPHFDVTRLSAAAGGQASVTFAVTNSGDAASPPQNLAVTLPAGVSVTAVTAASAPAVSALRRASAFLSDPAVPATADPAAMAAADPAVLAAAGPAGPVLADLAALAATAATTAPPLIRCTAAWACTYSVPPHRTLTVTLTVTLAPAALPGQIALTINGSRTGTPLALQVAPGLTALQLAPPAGWTVGTAAPARLTGTVAAGVTDVGTISIPLHGADIWLAPDESAVPNRCTASGALLTCSHPAISDGVADFGTVTATAVLPGGVTAGATLPGAGGTLTVAGPGGSALSASAPQPSHGPVALTGPFRAAVVGSAAWYCDGPTRFDCPSHQHRWAAMPGIAQPLPHAMAGHPVVAAVLTWAASEPAADVPSSVTLHVAGGPEVAVTGTLVGTDDLGEHNIDPSITQYTATVDGASLAGASGVTVRGLVPDDPGPALHMAAWTLTLVWLDPGSDSTISLYQPQAGLAAGGGAWTEPAGHASGSVTQVGLALWGTDLGGTKTIGVGTTGLPPTDPGACPTLDGLAPSPGGGCGSVGFSLLDVPVDPPLAGAVAVATVGDTVCVGVVLVVRSNT